MDAYKNLFEFRSQNICILIIVYGNFFSSSVCVQIFVKKRAKMPWFFKCPGCSLNMNGGTDMATHLRHAHHFTETMMQEHLVNPL